MSNQWSKLKWVQVVLFVAAFVVTVSLMVFSVLSYVQTEIAFRNFNDGRLIVFGFPAGLYVSHLFAMIFQYGQNVALAYRVMMPRPNFNFKIGNNRFNDRDIALWFFFVSAVIDAGTNILWMETVWTPSGVFIKDAIIRLIGWGVCIISVFFEELIGVVIDIWSWTGNQLGNTMKNEMSSKRRGSPNGGFRFGGDDGGRLRPEVKSTKLPKNFGKGRPQPKRNDGAHFPQSFGGGTTQNTPNQGMGFSGMLDGQMLRDLGLADDSDEGDYYTA